MKIVTCGENGVEDCGVGGAVSSCVGVAEAASASAGRFFEGDAFDVAEGLEVGEDDGRREVGGGGCE